MSSVQNLRALINERLTAAAEEIFTEFEKTIVQYEEEIDRQRRLLDITWKPQITLHITDFAQQHVCKEEEEVLAEQQLCNQETNSNLDPEDAKPPEIKEEQEELCTNLDQDEPEHPEMKEEQEQLCNNQEGEQLVRNQETYSFMLTQCKFKCEELSGEMLRVSETANVHNEKQIDHERRLIDVIWKPQIKLHRIDLQQQLFCEEQEVRTDHQLCNQEWNSSLDQKDPEPSQIREEQEEHCSSQEVEQLGLKQDTDASMVTPIYEENYHSEPEPNGDQLLSHNRHLAENANWDGSKLAGSGSTQHVELKPKKMRHRKSSHSNNVGNSAVSESQCDADTGKKLLTCDVCGKNFKLKFSLKRHYRIHAGEKPFACKTCGKSFRQSHHLNVHMRTHNDEKLHLCNTCGKRFHGLHAFERHTANHRDNKPYSCETCGKSFSRKHKLLCHMRIHTGEKPNSCKTCGKSFNRTDSLLVHMRIHTGEKPYLCNTCGRRFNDPSSFRNHATVHTGVKRHICSTCGKRLASRSSLKRHVAIHTVVK